VSVQPAAVQDDFPLARLTTVRTGGNADFFARPRNEGELLVVLTWAAAEGLALGVVGSGSNLLVADSGFRGLALKLGGELAVIERDGDGVLCGGGARFPSVSAKAAAWGLAGIEFGVNIPGTAGGAVKMNANAYGGQLAEALDWVDVFTATGRQRRSPDSLDFAYRSSNLTPNEVVSRVAFNLRRDDPAAIRARLNEMRVKRREAQPSGIKTFGSTFKNPDPQAPGVESPTLHQLRQRYPYNLLNGMGIKQKLKITDPKTGAQIRKEKLEVSVLVNVPKD